LNFEAATQMSGIYNGNQILIQIKKNDDLFFATYWDLEQGYEINTKEQE
jgi:hypothetical protein